MCAKNNIWAAGAITKTIDANFDLTKATVNTIELDLTKTDKEVSVVFIWTLNKNYDYTMSDNGV